MIHFLELIFFLFSFKAILRCLYFWQLKEYRFDRFKDLFSSQEIKNYLLPTKFFLKPKITIKILLLIYLSSYLFFQILKTNLGPLTPILAYLSLPLLVAINVGLLSPLTQFSYGLIILIAKIKMRLSHKSTKVIGITGSFGKTSTKEILSEVLAGKYSVCKTPATRNTAIGVALTILKSLKKSHQIFIVEMGAYRRGEIKQICQIVRPQIGILTGINQQHLSLFGSLDNTIKAKMELIQSLPENGLAIFNAANPITKKLKTSVKSVKSITYQLPKPAFKTNLVGDFFQTNLSAVYLVAKHLKLTDSQIKSKFLTLPDKLNSLKPVIGLNKANIINHTYSSNPQGFNSAIKHAGQLKSANKILITSGIIELGDQSASIHRQLARESLKVFDEVYITKKNIYQHFSQQNKNVVFAPDLNKLLQLLKPKLSSNTLVLLESRLPIKFINLLCQNQS